MPENIKYTGAPTVTPEEARRTAAIPGYQLNFPEVRLTRAGEEAGAEFGRAAGVLGGTMSKLGQAVDSLGKMMDGAGNELWQRAVGLKQLESETKVNNATVAWEQDQVKRDIEFEKLKGEGASSGALDAKQKADEDARQKVRNALGSQYEQKLFDQQTTRQYMMSIRRSAEHSAKELRTQATQGLEARLNLMKNNGLINAKEDADFAASDDEGKRIFMNERRHLLGQNEDQAMVDYMDWRTSGIVGRAQKFSADGDNTHALAILDAYREDLNKVDAKMYTEAYGRIKAKANRDEAWTAADKAVGSGKPDDTYEAQEKRLFDELNRTGRIKDIEFTKEAQSNLKSMHATQEYKFNEDRRKAEDFTSRNIHGLNPVQNRVKPKSEKELMAIPGMDEVWPKLSGDQQKRFLDVLDINARGNYPDTPEAKAEFRYWQGTLLLNPKELMDKMTEDNTFIDKLKIPEHYRDTLYNGYLRAVALGEKADEDTRVGRIYAYGKQNFLIPASVDGNKTSKARFYSYLSSELDKWHEDNPKQMPKADDYKLMLNRARSNVETPGPFGLWNWSEETWRAATTPTDEFRFNFLHRDHPGASESQMIKAWTDTWIAKRLKDQERGGKVTPKPVKVQPITVGPGG